MTHKDPAMRKMFAEKDFRVALSLGIDRAEVIDLVYLGQSQPWQTGPRPSHPWYYEKLSKQYIEHDPDKANALLDKLGYDKKDGQGFRLRPDGKQVFFAIDVTPTRHRSGSTHSSSSRSIGPRSAWTSRSTRSSARSSTRAATTTSTIRQVWGGAGGLDPMFDPRDYFAQHTQGSRYALAWAQWYVSGGKQGEEPPESQKERMKLYDEAKATADLEERGKLMHQVFELCADAFETVGVCLAVSTFGMCKNNFHNVPTKEPGSWTYPNPAPSLPQQYTF